MRRTFATPLGAAALCTVLGLGLAGCGRTADGAAAPPGAATHTSSSGDPSSISTGASGSGSSGSSTTAKPSTSTVTVDAPGTSLSQASGQQSPSSTTRATTHPTSPSASSTSTGSVATLRQLAGTTQVTSIKVSTGYEAMAFTARRVTFFASADGVHWNQAGSLAIPSQIGPSPVRITAAELGGGHATFVLDAGFTGDGTGDFLAFGRAGGNWGALRAEGGVLRPVTSPVASTVAPSYHLAISGGTLVQKALWPRGSTTIAAMRLNPVVRTWSPAGDGTFRLRSDNLFHGVLSSTPNPTPQQPRAGDGTFRVRVVSTDGSNLTFVPQAISCAGEGGNEDCGEVGGPRTAPVSDEARTRLMAEGAGGTSWVSAPTWAWLLMLIEDTDASDFADSPYRLPAGVAHLSRPTDAVVRISGGQIVELHQAFKV